MSWFILKDDEIFGPFNKAELLTHCDNKSLIWGPGMDTWMNLTSWKNFLSTPKEKLTPLNQIESSVSLGSENKSIDEVAEQALHQLNDKWYFSHKNKRHGPFNQNHLLLKISSLEQLEDILLWKKGEQTWKPIYKFPKLLKALNQKLEDKNAA